ncbi:MAG: sigma-70 family RNA polymerase sigma factor [Bacteroidetes bacterium]|nr:sigma-70 family RNA polymerase sigma factor [Bacteroidota bacterium]
MSKEEKDVFFEKEFFPFLKQMHGFAYHLSQDEDEASDLVQDTFLKAYRFMDSFERGTNTKAWLYRILKNTFINEYRRKTNLPSHVSLDVSYHQDDDGAPVNESFVQVLDNVDYYKHLIGDEISTALSNLQEEFREIIMLSDLEGFSYEEMAKILDIPIGTVRSRLFRARNFLKESLKAYGEKHGFKDKRGAV